MAYITLKAPWTYRTPLRTIPYPKGKHRVTADIVDAAKADGAIKDETDGDSDTDASPPGDTDPAEE